MPDERCDNCRFWFRSPMLLPKYGFCRRYAPVVDKQHPATEDAYWCGEYEPKKPTETKAD